MTGDQYPLQVILNPGSRLARGDLRDDMSEGHR